jgi:SAM-dependent methyltransferase
VIDATCGAGRDTLFLARLVGSAGRVWAFDVQHRAMTSTGDLLRDAGCLQQVTLVCSGHELLAVHVREPVRAVVFNLGFMPGGDHGTLTGTETTLAALGQAADLLLPGGILVIAVYTGHPGGAEEGTAVEEWAARLPPRGFNTWKSRQLNRAETAPYLVLVEKLR